jgi:hypothetical protein
MVGCFFLTGDVSRHVLVQIPKLWESYGKQLLNVWKLGIVKQVH